MQLGGENRTKVIVAVVVGVIALVQVVRMAWPSGPEAAPVAVASVTATSSSANSTPKSASSSKPTKTTPRLVADSQSSLDPTLRLQLLRSVEGIAYSGSGRNIFVEQQEVVIPPVAKNVQTDVPTGPPAPPPPPQITLKFFGFTNHPGEAKKVFLSEGEDVFIASEGDIVNRRYKVVRISPNAVEIEDMLYNHSQSIPLTQS